MPINDDQRSRRRKRIGSSDSPPIVGVDPWRNAGDVFVEKTQDLLELPAKEAVEIGNDFETPLLRWAARELGVEIRENVEAVHPQLDFLAANLDALVLRKPQALEAKTGTGADYGAPGTDQVPERVIVQCQHQMFVKDLELVWVPVLIAKFDRLSREMYCVKRSEPLIELIVERDQAFWENHVLPRVPPDAFLPSLAVLQRVRRVPKTLAVVDPLLVSCWKEAVAVKKLAEQEEERQRRNLIAALGDAAGADFGDPRKLLTFQGYSYEQVDSTRLKAEDPEMWKKWARTVDVSPSLREINRK